MKKVSKEQEEYLEVLWYMRESRNRTLTEFKEELNDQYDKKGRGRARIPTARL